MKSRMRWLWAVAVALGHVCCYVAAASSQSDPLALHHLYEVDPGGEIVISLRGLDLDGDETTATILSLPSSGSLHQLSFVFDRHGYDPKAGEIIDEVPIVVTGSNGRVVYRRPEVDREWDDQRWGSFEYEVREIKRAKIAPTPSRPGTVTLVGPSWTYVASEFVLDGEGWTVTQGRRATTSYGNTDDDVAQRSLVIHEPSSRGPTMSHYVYASDASVNVDREGRDLDVWRFVAPSKFLGNVGVAYGGTFGFVLSSFGGDFGSCGDGAEHEGDQQRRHYLVRMECASCDRGNGVALGWRPGNSDDERTVMFSGKTTPYSIPLTESGGWKKDPKNQLLKWTVPTKCDFVQVLSGISRLEITGDLTDWYETVSLDGVRIVTSRPRGRNQLPPCAQRTPDATGCDCVG